MSFLSFLKNNKESYSLVFDICSGSITGSLIKFTKQAEADIVYYARETIPFQHEVSATKHLNLLQSTLEKLANNIRTEGLRSFRAKSKNICKIDRVFYIFSSPWSTSQTKIIKIKKAKSFKVTAQYLENIIQEQETNFRVGVAKTGEIIEKKITQLKLDGVVMDDFQNQNVKELEISLFLTTVPKEILSLIDHAVAKSFIISEVWYHSLSLIALSTIKELFPENDEYLYMDISEEMTDISIIKDSALSTGITIPHGRNHFIRELTNSLKVSSGIADSMIKLHSHKNNNEFASLRLAVAMDKASQNWFVKLSDVLSSFTDKISIPESVFLLSKNDLSHFLMDKLMKQEFKVVLLNNKRVRHSLIEDNNILKMELRFLDNLYKI